MCISILGPQIIDLLTAKHTSFEVVKFAIYLELVLKQQL